MTMFVCYQGQTIALNKNIVQDLVQSIYQQQSGQIYCVSAGKLITQTHGISELSLITIFNKLKGGKGGFGAKLKNQGGKKVKPNQNMFSRDLQGRPIAYSNIQRDYKDYYAKKIIQEEKINKQIADYKVVENTLKQQYTFMKLDRTYNAQISQTQSKLCSSLKTGLSKFLQKRSNERTQQPICLIDSILKDSGQQKKQISDHDKIDGQKRERVVLQEDLAEDGGATKKRKTEVISLNQKSKGCIDKGNADKINVGQPVAVQYLSARDKLKNLFKK